MYLNPPSLEEIKTCVEKRLFVGRLPANTTEVQLREVFGNYGTMIECRVVEGKNIGFVTYETWGAAHRALVGTDGINPFRGSAAGPITVSFALRSGRQGGANFAKGFDICRVFVGGLKDGCTDEDLKRVFADCGDVRAANVLEGKGTTKRRCGFVNFAYGGEALDAIEKMNGQEAPQGIGSDLKVLLAQNREPQLGVGGGGAKREPPGLSSGGPFEDLKISYCQAVDGDAPDDICDELHRKIMMTRPSRRGYMGQWQGQWQGGKGGGKDNAKGASAPGLRLVGEPREPIGALPDFASSCDERDAARLFFSGLPPEATGKELKSLIDLVPFTVSTSQLEECRTLPGKGLGYVRFNTWEEASEALHALHGRQVDPWRTPLNVSWSKPRGSS